MAFTPGPSHAALTWQAAHLPTVSRSISASPDVYTVCHTSSVCWTPMIGVNRHSRCPINHTNPCTVSAEARLTVEVPEALWCRVCSGSPPHILAPEKSGPIHAALCFSRPVGTGQRPDVLSAAPSEWQRFIFGSENKLIMTDGIHLGTLGMSQAQFEMGGLGLGRASLQNPAS